MARGNVRVSITADTSGLKRGVGEAERDLTRLGRAGSRSGTTLSGSFRKADKERSRFSAGLRSLAGVAAAAGGITLVTNAISASISEYQESVKVGKQTEAALKSTGNAAHVSAKQIGDLAQAISNKVGIDDEAIQSAENLLLTFTNVRNETGKGNDVFNRATKTIVDMSVAMHTPLKNASILVGKALNDPIKGMTALSRVGVTFTAQQKDQIATLVKSGKTLDAQKLIMRELNREFGGSAAKAATPLDKLKVSIANLEESVGRLLMPTINKGANALAKFVDQMQTGKGAGGRFVDVLKRLWQGVKDVANALAPTIKSVAKFVGQHPGILKVAGGIVAVGVAMKALRFTSAISGATTLWNLLNKIAKTKAGTSVVSRVVGTPTAPPVPVVTKGLSPKTVLARLGLRGVAPRVVGGVLSIPLVVAGVISLVDKRKGRSQEILDNLKKTQATARQRVEAINREIAKVGDRPKAVTGGRTRRVNPLLNVERDLKNALPKLRAQMEKVDITTGFAKQASKAKKITGDLTVDMVQRLAKVKGPMRKETAQALVSMSAVMERMKTVPAGSAGKVAGAITRVFGPMKLKAGQSAKEAVDAIVRQFGGLAQLLEGPFRNAQAKFLTFLRNMRGAPDRSGYGQGSRRRRGGAMGYRDGGLVPAMVSPGEQILHGNRSWVVPGQRVAADNVFTMLPTGAAVLTDDGQARMAAGQSLGRALASQAPHFGGGGRAYPKATTHRGPASWYGGPNDKGDLNPITAFGYSHSHPGISLREALFNSALWGPASKRHAFYRVVAPNKRVAVLPLIDKGPGSGGTGSRGQRWIDIGTGALHMFGYTEGNFPTDSIWRWTGPYYSRGDVGGAGRGAGRGASPGRTLVSPGYWKEPATTHPAYSRSWRGLYSAMDERMDGSHNRAVGTAVSRAISGLGLSGSQRRRWVKPVYKTLPKFAVPGGGKGKGKGKSGSFAFGGHDGRPTAWRGVGRAGLGAGIQWLASRVMGRFPGISVSSTTGGKHATHSFHYQGRAVDLVGPNLNSVAAWVRHRYAANLAEGIHNPNLSVEGGRFVSPGYWGPDTWAGHAGHIHLAARRGLSGKLTGSKVAAPAPKALAPGKKLPFVGPRGDNAFVGMARYQLGRLWNASDSRAGKAEAATVLRVLGDVVKGASATDLLGIHGIVEDYRRRLYAGGIRGQREQVLLNRFGNGKGSGALGIVSAALGARLADPVKEADALEERLGYESGRLDTNLWMRGIDPDSEEGRREKAKWRMGAVAYLRASEGKLARYQEFASKHGFKDAARRLGAELGPGDGSVRDMIADIVTEGRTSSSDSGDSGSSGGTADQVASLLTEIRDNQVRTLQVGAVTPQSLAALLTEIISGEIGGRVGLGMQSPSFAGRGGLARY